MSIARASHNILAFRLTTPSGNLLSDCDDDGESAAGGRLLHLLNIVGAANVCVVVSRWYGGIHLGPDRFKHINSVARQLLASQGYIGGEAPGGGGKKKPR
ncbi:ribosomal protein S5 domain 2-type protein [Baffinella frigidus]|nr:ribosomal protein S5 domain 2-type protein [Cryptophyta sp. CCMP2293]